MAYVETWETTHVGWELHTKSINFVLESSSITLVVMWQQQFLIFCHLFIKKFFTSLRTLGDLLRKFLADSNKLENMFFFSFPFLCFIDIKKGTKKVFFMRIFLKEERTLPSFKGERRDSFASKLHFLNCTTGKVLKITTRREIISWKDIIQCL